MASWRWGGTATILVLARLAQDVAGRVTALIAAVFLSAAILHVRDSHFATVDVLTTLFATATLAYLMAAMRSDATKWYALAGLMGGLATSTKYSVALLMVSMGAAQLVRLYERRAPFWSLRAWIPPVVFAAAFVAGFAAGTPYAFLDFPTFRAAIWNDSQQLSHGHNIILGRGWWYHIRHTLPFGLGLPIFACAIAGWIPFFRYHRAPPSSSARSPHRSISPWAPATRCSFVTSCRSCRSPACRRQGRAYAVRHREHQDRAVSWTAARPASAGDR